MTGAEALMRWIDPECGMQYPSDFIPVLEENDLLYRADIQMVEFSCKLLRHCIDNDIPAVPISFNMSRNDIFKHEYVEDVEKVRQKYDIPVKYLRVEITETSAIGGIELMSSVIKRFHELGYIVEMDDFGSGYSSLNTIAEYDFDVLKLDLIFLKSFSNLRTRTLMSYIIKGANDLGVKPLCEGVETEEHYQFLKQIGCERAQGYYFGKPMPLEDTLEEIRQKGLRFEGYNYD
jgi:EAL domain-containing protein (putative c-di-GMP-specific phosphodiesterase class I)